MSEVIKGQVVANGKFVEGVDKGSQIWLQNKVTADTMTAVVTACDMETINFVDMATGEVFVMGPTAFDSTFFVEGVKYVESATDKEIEEFVNTIKEKVSDAVTAVEIAAAEVAESEVGQKAKEAGTKAVAASKKAIITALNKGIKGIEKFVEQVSIEAEKIQAEQEDEKDDTYKDYMKSDKTDSDEK